MLAKYYILRGLRYADVAVDLDEDVRLVVPAAARRYDILPQQKSKFNAEESVGADALIIH
jgi:hypothetical protein